MSSSLDLLLSPSAPSAHQPRNLDSTANELERRTVRMTDLLNDRDFSHPDFDHWLSREYECIGGVASAKSTTRQEYMENWRSFAEKHPSYSVTPLVVSSEMDKERGLVKVWALARISLGERSRESVTVLSWKNTTSGWKCYQLMGTRGIGQSGLD